MATEDRWHDFAKEKPSEDMEGRNFIVSNGHYEKIATWCGYWENEPFMGNKLCDEVVRWKGYLTPEEEKANEATRTELKADKTFVFGEECEAYKKSDVDELLAEKDKEIARLKAEIDDVRNTYKDSVEIKVKIWERCKKAEVDAAETLALLEERNKQVAELKERSQWHRQKDKDIFFECGKHWGAEYIIKMKDGTTHLAYGGCDEGGDGSVSTFLHFKEDDDWDNDYEWEYDDIDIWYEIPDPKIDGNIKEAYK